MQNLRTCYWMSDVEELVTEAVKGQGQYYPQQLPPVLPHLRMQHR